jgi:Putative prokaryotic signal transducing protein
MLQGLLTESGIPSILKRSGGFDAPEFLAAGPRDIWVNKSHAQEARRILEETMTEGDDEAEERSELDEEAHLRATGGDPMTPGRLALWVAGGLIVAIVIIWIVYEIAS